MSARSRAFIFTINNWTPEDLDYIKYCGYQYVVYGKEVGESGTPHLQGYVYFKTQRTLKSVSKKLPRAHLEVRKGSHKQAKEYCIKDGVFEEYGDEPQQSGGDSMAERARRNKRLRELPFDELLATGELMLSQVPVIKKARTILANETKAVTEEDVRGIWFYGPPGTGKTHEARQLEGTIYVKAQNKWFDGYVGEDIILLDDLDTPTLGHYLKIWADKWSCNGEIKGGTVPLRHKKFVVTSNYLPKDLWSEDNMMRRAIERRFKIIEKTIKY